MPPETGPGKSAAGKRPPPPSMKPMLLMFAPIFLWILLFPFAPIIAAPLRPLLDPLAARSFQGTIALLGAVSAVISTLLRFRFTDWKKMRAFQEKQQRVGKQLREAMKSQNKHLMQKAREEQMAMTQESMAMQSEMMKPTLLLVFVSLPFFMWIYTAVPPPVASVNAVVAWADGCPNATVGISKFPNGTLDLSVRDPNGASNLSACGNLTPLHAPALQFVAARCPYRTSMGPLRDHIERCIEAGTGGLFRVPPLGPGDSGNRHPTDLALRLAPWWIAWYMLVSLPTGHLVQKALEDRMRRKEREATEAAGGAVA